ncbi:MAG: hypothetical protein H8F28_27760 [Fibrella sp.]|nr:hypothetical protein [Armatimonadota bacterium]
MTRATLVGFGSVVALSLLAGCDSRDTPSDVASPPATARGRLVMDDEFFAANDQPAFSAPGPRSAPLGIVVASPVVSHPDKNTKNDDFASGIGWYLTNAVAGAPEFGQSPLYTTVFQASRRHRILSLRMSPTDAARVARISGATHIATGRLEETAADVTLRYRISSLPVDDTNPPIPQADVSISAKNRAGLMAQLPTLAQNLRAALGVKKSVVTAPPLQSVSPELLARIGYCADSPRYTSDQSAFLADAGKTVPLAVGLAVLKSSAPPAPYIRFLLQKMPRNTQAIGVAGTARPEGVGEDAAIIYALSDRFTDNYILAHTAAGIAQIRSDRNRESAYSERGVRNAPANPDAHLLAAGSVEKQASRLRKGRRDADMDADDLAKIKPLYAEWMTQTRIATQCDPLYEKAYERLANAALLAGAPTEADAAMTLARKLIRRDPYDTYAWALEMYQPQWIDNPARLREVAIEAASARYYWDTESLTIYRKLGELRFADLQQTMGDRLLRETEETLTHDPRDMYAHFLHGTILQDRGKQSEALADFQANARNYPTNPGIQFELGKHYIDRGEFVSAEAAFRASLALRPRNAETLCYLGDALWGQEDNAGARDAWQAAVRIGTPVEAVRHAEGRFEKYPVP